ncbi:hypothetical protein [Intestinibacter bartlettii]|uniref:DUF5659 domain-containing protein n=1 Tax=Intestinibacter bartlettii TaxID=261299 RepID=A0ABS6DZ26_9FIRM|nr:hypothetical protein [Intestinibacter bartlettii]MBU5337089.1 hypothetical protein [Intestinibacter bartlettii]MDO5009476.1 hypothetical protein [Intestinibacter bartlettii]
MYNFESVKNLYQDGYRCIYYDSNESNPCVYLKNFDSEDSKEIQFEDEEQFTQFKDYLDSLNSLRG